MKRTQMRVFQILLCGLLAVACNRMGSQSPPKTTYRIETIDVSRDEILQKVRGAFVTPKFIQVVRAQPLLGRYFLAEEYQAKSQKVVVLSWELWQRRFGGDPAIIGTDLKLNSLAYKIIGIMPKGFSAPEGVELWIPAEASGEQGRVIEPKAFPSCGVFSCRST